MENIPTFDKTQIVLETYKQPQWGLSSGSIVPLIQYSVIASAINGSHDTNVKIALQMSVTFQFVCTPELLS